MRSKLVVAEECIAKLEAEAEASLSSAITGITGAHWLHDMHSFCHLLCQLLLVGTGHR